MNLFELKDKSGRKIYLSKERWKHINQEHPEISPYLDELKEALENPLAITTYPLEEGIRYYYQYLKERTRPEKYLLIIVKYLNGDGFVITSYFVRNIK